MQSNLQIKQLQLSVYTQDDIVKYGVCLNDKNNQNKIDLSITKIIDKCQVCNKDFLECVGHMFYIKLTKEQAMYNATYFQTVLKLLQIYCNYCSNLLIEHKYVLEIRAQLEQEDIETDVFFQNMIRLIKQKQKKKCSNCQQEVHAIKAQYQHQPKIMKKDINKELSISDVMMILERIPTNQWEVLFKKTPNYKPSDLIFHSVFPVLPEQVRPTFYDQQYEHKWGSLYSNLVNAIQTNNIANAYNLVTQITGLYFPGQQKQAKIKQQVNSIKDTLFKGKESIFRKYLFGKRIEVSARTVLGPDINLEVDQVGVPVSVLKDLTYQEEVTSQNIDFLQKLVNNRDNYPGARVIEISPYYYEKHFGKIITKNLKINVSIAKENLLQLKEGYIVHRHLLANDYVIMNRQPTLHRQSMLALRIVPHAGFTFMLSPGIVSCQNADFDGDEAALTFCTDIHAQNQVKKIMNPLNNAMSNTKCKPLIKPSHDTILGLNEIELYQNHKITKQEFGFLTHNVKNSNLRFEEGKTIADYFKDLNKTSTGEVPNYGYINSKEIQQLYHKHWFLEKNNLLNQVTDFSFFANNILDLFKRTLNLGDCMLFREKSKFLQVHSDLRKKMMQFEQMSIEGKNPSQEVSKYEKECLDLIKANSDPMMNNFFIIVNSGAKGTLSNYKSVCMYLGKQMMGAENYPINVKGRLSPHYVAGQQAFVKSGFMVGFDSITEFTCHIGSGRKALMETALETAIAGYIYRKLDYFMMDMITSYNCEIRQQDKLLISPSYACINIDVKYLVIQQCQFLSISEKQMIDQLSGVDKQIIELAVEIKRRFRDLRFRANMDITKIQDTVYFPFFFDDLYSKFQALDLKSSMESAEIRNKYNKLLIEYIKEYTVIYSTKDQEIKKFFNEQQRQLQILLLIENLNGNKLMKNNVSPSMFAELLKYMKKMLLKYRVSPGESVGNVAAQSLGETITQMTLNTFHTAGQETVAGMKDIPYINKIIDKINDKTPMIVLNLQEEFQQNEEVVDKLMRELKEVKFNEVVQSYNIRLMYKGEFKIKTSFQVKPNQIKYDIQHICQKLTQFIEDQDVQFIQNNKFLFTYENNEFHFLFNGNLMYKLTDLVSLVQKIFVCTIQGSFNIKNMEKRKVMSQFYGKEIFQIVLECREQIQIYEFADFPEIDVNTSTQTNIFGLQKQLGICGMNGLIYSSLYNTLEKTDNTQFAQHIDIIANTMCHKPQITQFHRNKIQNIQGFNTLTYSTFEKSHKFMVDGVLGQTVSNSDNAVSSVIMNGHFKNGFGKFKVSRKTEIPKVMQQQKNYIIEREKVQKSNKLQLF